MDQLPCDGGRGLQYLIFNVKVIEWTYKIMNTKFWYQVSREMEYRHQL